MVVSYLLQFNTSRCPTVVKGLIWTTALAIHPGNNSVSECIDQADSQVMHVSAQKQAVYACTSVIN